jgi:hypothetical protein
MFTKPIPIIQTANAVNNLNFFIKKDCKSKLSPKAISRSYNFYREQIKKKIGENNY